MKKILNYMVLVILSTTVMVSCYDDYLDPVPQTSISDLTAFDTRDRILGQVNGLYAAVKSGQYLGGRYQIYNDIRTDDFLNLQTNGVTGYQTWTHNMATSTNEVQNLWGQVYFAINRINVFIDGIEAERERIISANIISQAEYDQFRGEALALRGMAYFHLSMLYARPYNQNPNGWGLILRVTAQKDETGNDMARATVAETYQQIITDLTTAMGLLPLSHSGSSSNNDLDLTRMQRNSAIALLTRVYLHQSNYNGVLTEGNKIVPAAAPFVAGNGGVAYALASEFADVFAAPYTSSESIFSIPMTTSELPGTQNQLGHYFAIPPAGNNEYPINTASPVWTSTVFPEDDARREMTVENEASGETHVFLTKYTAFPHVDYAPVIRYAEVLLNVAEAEARVNGVNARAVALLNAVHQRSNPDGGFAVADFANADAFVAQVLLERNMEFLGEGIRNMDITRNVSPFGAKGPVPAIPPTSTSYVWPIPQSEFNTNNLVQPND